MSESTDPAKDAALLAGTRDAPDLVDRVRQESLPLPLSNENGPPQATAPLWVTDRYTGTTALLIAIDKWETMYDTWGFDYEDPLKAVWAQRTLPKLVAKVSAAFPDGADPFAVLMRWESASKAWKGDSFVPRTIAYLHSAMREHGIWFAEGPKEFAPVRQEILAALPYADPNVEIANPYLGVAKIAELLYDRLTQERPVIMVIDSIRDKDVYGTGKSSLLIQIYALLAWMLVQGGHVPAPGWDMRRDIMYGPDHERLLRWWDEPTPYAFRGIDEGKWFAFKRDVQSKETKDILKSVPHIRKRRQPWIIAVDNIFGLDKDVVELAVTHRIRIMVKYGPDPFTGKEVILDRWAEVYEKGPIDKATDLWGGERPRFLLRWDPLPDPVHALYLACNALSEEVLIHRGVRSLSPLDDALSEDPSWGLHHLPIPPNLLEIPPNLTPGTYI